jgi:hypothetical protein
MDTAALGGVHEEGGGGGTYESRVSPESSTTRTSGLLR